MTVPVPDAPADGGVHSSSDSDEDWLLSHGGGGGFLDGGAFDRPFASHHLVFSKTSVEEDEIRFCFQIVDDDDGETLCEITPGLKMKHIKHLLFNAQAADEEGDKQGHEHQQQQQRQQPHQNLSSAVNSEVDKAQRAILSSSASSSLSSERLEATSQAILALGMSVLCYVWMGFLCPKIVVQRGAWSCCGCSKPLKEDQLRFWRTVLLKSLREHFFVNGVWTLDGKGGLEALQLTCDADDDGDVVLDKDDDVEAVTGEAAIDAASRESTTPVEENSAEAVNSEPFVLVPMGAGKDSTVAWELLGLVEPPIRRRWFFLEGSPGEFERCWRYGALAEASGVDIEDVLVAEFVWPASAFERYRNSALQMVGHPWAAIVSFASVLVALAHGASHVAVGNERSAGLGNGVLWEGVEVNHQWDKAFEYEEAAAAYLEKHCKGVVKYFSVLSSIWDLQVAMLFQRLCSRYSSLIVSCNQPQGPCASRWCGSCAKCAFVAAALGAFFPVSETRALFGDDPFESGSLTGHLDLLAGLPAAAGAEDQHAALVSATLPAPARARCKILTNPWKPLECVGGPEETRLALQLVQEKYLREKRRLPAFFTPARCAYLANDAQKPDLSLLEDWSEEHLLPTWLQGVVKRAVEEAATDLQQQLSKSN